MSDLIDTTFAAFDSFCKETEGVSYQIVRASDTLVVTDASRYSLVASNFTPFESVLEDNASSFDYSILSPEGEVVRSGQGKSLYGSVAVVFMNYSAAVLNHSMGIPA